MFFAIKRFANRNRKLFILSIISTVIILSYYITYDVREIIPGIEKWYKLISDLSLGVITSLYFIFFKFIYQGFKLS